MKARLFPFLLLLSCSRPEGPEPQTPPEPDARIVTTISKGAPASRSDVLVYGPAPLKRLEYHRTVHDSKDTLVLRTTPGEKTMVLFENLPYTLKDEAVAAYEAVEYLTLRLEDESPSRPFASAEACFLAGDAVFVKPNPLIASVELSYVEQNLGGYERLVNPVVYLENAAAECEALRSDSFFPQTFIQDTIGLRGLVWDRLPYDIGFYPQSPKLKLWCLPNESPTLPTMFVFEALVKGSRRRFETTLPKIGRNSSTKLELTIDSETNYSWKVYQVSPN